MVAEFMLARNVGNWSKRWRTAALMSAVGVIVTDLAAPQGFEPRYADPESAVLPLNEGAAEHACQYVPFHSRVQGKRGQYGIGRVRPA